jgi:hypothetical protein
MGTALDKALMLMAIALPTMFFVIAVFMGLTMLLHRLFPASAEPVEEDSDD